LARSTNHHNRLAVITGASSGIGAAFAEKVAERGMNLILIARRGERLQQLAERLQRNADISARVIVADLTDRLDLGSVEEEIRQLGSVDLLVNSAGYGIFESLAADDPDLIERQLFLDLVVPARLIRAALPGMIGRRQGAIINVSSMAAFLPIPKFATYCAAKAGLTRLTQALHGELAGTGVRVQALCPGPVPTEFFAVSGYDVADVPRPMIQQAEACVESSLRALEKGTLVHIPHPVISVFLAVLGLFSSKTQTRILGSGTKWWMGRSAGRASGRDVPAEKLIPMDS
jgi:short-subunit dehydrogenase